VRATTTALYELPAPDPLSSKHSPLTTVAIFPTPGLARRVFPLLDSEDEIIVACSSSLTLFNIERPDTPAAQITSSDLPFFAASPDPIHSTSHVVAVSSGPSVKLWDIRAGKLEHELANAHTPDVLDIAFNPNKPWWICTGGSDGLLKCWDARDPKVAAQFKAKQPLADSRNPIGLP
jgi:WD40 repeat protein